MKIPSLIGVIHLPALSGAPGAASAYPSDTLQKAGLWAVKEAKALSQAGFDGIILENFGDVPFYKDRVPPETVACMSVIAAAVRETTRVPLGINVLRNDARAALAIAAVTGCDFIRVNVLSGVAATDQGIVEGDAAYLMRERQRLGSSVAIFADIHVKHARSLSSDDPALAAEDLIVRAGADGVIVTGSGTGKPVDPGALEKVYRLVSEHGLPLYIGSGATPQNIRELMGYATGVIVGSALRKGGKAGTPLDPKRVKAFAQAFKAKGRKRK